ncbi:transcription factor elt-1-like [Argiope bruennichi]|uniref:GATA-type zinc finger protein 1 like protein n=1 Tax=Argiope bruennichi TaxID=94029 RepID=A0A8T0EJ39_ARGBR|nr:transcription factor elt-1-like [Argiope bruennichi]KAF8773541.1 GATA-type zinc finger protein 1 like protein [Argiope bruennichi]
MNCISALLKYADISSSEQVSNPSDALRTSLYNFTNEENGESQSGSSLNDSGIDLSYDSLNSSLNEGEKNVTGCRKRKNFVPCRSSPLNDPNFRGVTITMHNRLVNSEWKLIIRSKFTLSPRKKRKIRNYAESSDEEDVSNSSYSTVIEEKHCASCSAKKTPLWRDAEDGTPLCNACGIRYKKYKLRCGTCWHIPKKDEFHPTCQYCGSFYEYVYPRR